MSFRMAWGDQISDPPSTTQLYPIGEVRKDITSGKIYRYFKATATLASNQAVRSDYTDSTGAGVVPVDSITRDFAGVAEQAFVSGQWGWFAQSGILSTKSLSAVVAGDLLAPSATSGCFGPASTVVTNQHVCGVALSNGVANNGAIPVRVFGVL